MKFLSYPVFHFVALLWLSYLALWRRLAHFLQLPLKNLRKNLGQKPEENFRVEFYDPWGVHGHFWALFCSLWQFQGLSCTIWNSLALFLHSLEGFGTF